VRGRPSFDAFVRSRIATTVVVCGRAGRARGTRAADPTAAVGRIASDFDRDGVAAGWADCLLVRVTRRAPKMRGNESFVRLFRES
jgi:hypothetical protein